MRGMKHTGLLMTAAALLSAGAVFSPAHAQRSPGTSQQPWGPGIRTSTTECSGTFVYSCTTTTCIWYPWNSNGICTSTTRIIRVLGINVD